MSDPSVPNSSAPVATAPSPAAPPAASPTVGAEAKVTLADLVTLFRAIQAEAKPEASSLFKDAGAEVKSAASWVGRTVKRWNLPALWLTGGSGLLMHFPSLLKMIGL